MENNQKRECDNRRNPVYCSWSTNTPHPTFFDLCLFLVRKEVLLGPRRVRAPAGGYYYKKKIKNNGWGLFVLQEHNTGSTDCFLKLPQSVSTQPAWFRVVENWRKRHTSDILSDLLLIEFRIFYDVKWPIRKWVEILHFLSVLVGILL